MRVFLSVIPIALLTSCTNMTSQSDILYRARAEVAARESWPDQALIRVADSPGYERLTWKRGTWLVTAGVLDQSDYPHYDGMKIVPGTERVLRFSPQGCLLKYGSSASFCSSRYQTPEPTVAAPIYPDGK